VVANPRAYRSAALFGATPHNGHIFPVYRTSPPTLIIIKIEGASLSKFSFSVRL
jgi:hypothetical protein